MKATWYMHYLNTFPLSKSKGICRRAAGGACKKLPKNAMKLTKSRL